MSEFEHTGCANSVLEEKGIRGARVCLYNRHCMHTSGKMPRMPSIRLFSMPPGTPFAIHDIMNALRGTLSSLCQPACRQACVNTLGTTTATP